MDPLYIIDVLYGNWNEDIVKIRPIPAIYEDVTDYNVNFDYFYIWLSTDMFVASLTVAIMILNIIYQNIYAV